MNNFTLSPLFRRNLGFDRLNDLFDDIMHSDVSYPPYNIEKRGEQDYRIVVAAAGFERDELDICLDNQVLTISGKSTDKKVEEENVAYLYKGLGQRAFKLSLRLDEHTEVTQASYDNGLLNIDLKRVLPETKEARKISIDSGSTPSAKLDVKTDVDDAA